MDRFYSTATVNKHVRKALPGAGIELGIHTADDRVRCMTLEVAHRVESQGLEFTSASGVLRKHKNGQHRPTAT